MRWLILIPAALLLTHCAPDPIPVVTADMAQSIDADEAKLRRGRELYMANCNRCHERVLPGKLDPEYWRGIIPHMAANAKLSTTEQNELLLYMMGAHNTVHHIHAPQ